MPQINSQPRLNWRQKRLLRDYLDDRSSIDDALKKRGLKPSLFQKWMDQPLFLDAYNKARHTRAIMAETNPSAEPGALHQQLQQRIATQAPQPPAPPEPPPLAEQTASNPPQAHRQTALHLSEREWVQSINGEEGAQAYDRLVELWEQYEHPTQTETPDSNDPPTSAGRVPPPQCAPPPSDSA